MFSFFRRSKKESDSNRNSEKNKEIVKDQNVPLLLDSRSKDMCKNNLTTLKSDNDALQGNSVVTPLPNSSTEFGLREILANVAPFSEVTTVNDRNNDFETTPIPIINKLNEEQLTNNCSETTDMNPGEKTAPIIPAPPTVSYASILRKPDNEVRSSNVKPCGHGTTAISPSVPVTWGKRDQNTPPSSPKFEARKTTKVRVIERQDSNSSDKEEKSGKDTITASMKLHLNLPTGTLVKSIENHGPPVDGKDSDGGKKNLINQEAKFQSQLNDLSKQLSIRDAEASKLRFQMEELQRDVFVKSAGMDRLEAELQAAYKESEIVRQRIKLLEHDLAEYRQKNNHLSSELAEKTENHVHYENEANAKIAELQTVIKELQIKIESLEAELETLKNEKKILEQQHAELKQENEEEKKKVAEALEQTAKQKQEIEKKWNDDFEKLRTINIMKEQQLLDDFEWKLREVQQTCKKRLEEKDRAMEERLQDAYREAEKKMKEAENMMCQVDTMKSYELEIEKLRGLTVDQDRSLKEMLEQQDKMKMAEDNLRDEAKKLRNMIEVEKENLQHMQRKHHQEILDKERTLKQTLNQKRTEIAMYWEERLLNECGRLKMELEQIHSEEKHFFMETARREKDEEFDKVKQEWELRMKELLKEIAALKRALIEKDSYYREEIVRTQGEKDQDILDLRRLMDKIDMTHHDRFEKLVLDHEEELERINEETETKIKELESSWQNQVTSLRTTLELVKEQMEKESQQKIESLIEQHRSELDAQWENLIKQKSEAVHLVEDEYVTKYKTLEEQFFTQQKSHEAREIELLKTIDSLKNELSSKESSLDDLQNNVDTLEGGIQVLNQEVANQCEQIAKNRKETEHKIRGLQETIAKLQEQQEKEREAFRLKLMGVQKQSTDSIEHLQRKCQCLTKLFEEVRLRYERRESRQEDLNIISDLRQVIAEQEKDLACLNEEKRYFQMRLINLEKRLDDFNNASGDDDAFEDAEQSSKTDCLVELPNYPPPAYPMFASGPCSNTTLSIPPTIPECDE